MALDILVVDDEQDIRELVSGVLEDEGYSTRGAANSSGALVALIGPRPSLVLLVVWLQGSKLDGLQLLEEVKRRRPTLPVLMISGHRNLDTAVAAVRQHPDGASIDLIQSVLGGAMARRTLQRRLYELVKQGRPIAEGRKRGTAYRLPPEAGLTEAEQRLVAGGNARRLLALRKTQAQAAE